MFNEYLTYEEAMALGFDPDIDSKYAVWDEESCSITYPKYAVEDSRKIRLT